MPITTFSDTNPGAQLRIGDQLIRYDRDLTQRAYAGISVGGAEECGCAYCENFIAQKSTIYPSSFIALLETLGIDPTKEGEVYECSPLEDNKHLYGGWFFFTGQILETGERQVEKDGIQYFIASGRQLPRSQGEFGLDLLALNFQIKVPWVLEELKTETQPLATGGQQ
jgi:hypothetical protein